MLRSTIKVLRLDQRSRKRVGVPGDFVSLPFAHNMTSTSFYDICRKRSIHAQ